MARSNCSQCVSLTMGLAMLLTGTGLRAEDKPQYEAGETKVPQAKADEPVAAAVSVAAAVTYLEQGNRLWSDSRGCISCHTNGTYMLVRPALSKSLGKPGEESRAFFVKTLGSLSAQPVEELKKSTRPAQVIYTAAGLAEWDAQLTGKLSSETQTAMKLMFDIQLETGTWGTLDCWPPYESDAFHEATVAAMAVAAAPGWRAGLTDDETKARVERLWTYLRTTPPPHDYGRVLLLWAACRVPDLLPAERKAELVEGLLKKQQADGGWSLRQFAEPEQWGKGNRAKKLRAEPEFAAPASDGHQTGLAIIVLRESGLPASDARIQSGVKWLLANQRVSGRWWTRSLNTDGPHYITYSGTAFPLLALQMCDALPKETASR